MNPVQARLILRQLDGVDDAIRARKKFAEVYHEGLRDIPEIVLPPLRTDFSHTYTYFPIQVDDREKVLRHLMTEHRDIAGQHLKNCADLDCFAEYRRECPNARRTSVSLVLLPTYPRYSARDVEANIASLRRYFGRS
jgi:dTDP-4-amino-4,6-dideoxygalactose transaminase